MKYFSTFSGIGGFDIAIESVFPDAQCAGFAEIDPYAIGIYMAHFPNHKNYGDVTISLGYKFFNTMQPRELPDFDLLVGGSPCQDLSISKKNRTGLKGARSGLFYRFVDILNKKHPKYFVLENVESMPRQDRNEISKILGVEAVCINAANVSAQNRKRLFWANFPITQPEDRGIMLRDIIHETNGEFVDDKYIVKNPKYLKYINSNVGKKFTKINGDKTIPQLSRQYANWKGQYVLGNTNPSARGMNGNVYDIDAKSPNTTNKGEGNKIYKSVRIANINKGSQGERIYSVNGKSVNLSALGGGLGAKTGLYLIDMYNKTIKTDKAKTLGNNPQCLSSVAGQVLIFQTPRGYNEGGMKSTGKTPPMTTSNWEHNNYLLIHQQDLVQTDQVKCRTIPAGTHGSTPHLLKTLINWNYIRKLTPIECERLQGFSDGWTDGISNSQRYKCLGNAVNVEVVKHIMECLKNHTKHLT